MRTREEIRDKLYQEIAVLKAKNASNVEAMKEETSKEIDSLKNQILLERETSGKLRTNTQMHAVEVFADRSCRDRMRRTFALWYHNATAICSRRQAQARAISSILLRHMKSRMQIGFRKWNRVIESMRQKYSMVTMENKVAEIKSKANENTRRNTR